MLKDKIAYRHLQVQSAEYSWTKEKPMLHILIERSLIGIAVINADSGGSKYRYKLSSLTVK